MASEGVEAQEQMLFLLHSGVEGQNQVSPSPVEDRVEGAGTQTHCCDELQVGALGRQMSGSCNMEHNVSQSNGFSQRISSYLIINYCLTNLKGCIVISKI